MKVSIQIRSAVTDDGETQTAEQTVLGFYRTYDAHKELTYREDGLSNTLTTLRLYPAKAELTRQGDFSGTLVMEVGNRHENAYATPFGTLTLVTDTAALCSTLSDDGNGTLSLHYTLSAGGNSSEHDLFLTVTPFQ